MKLKHVTLYAKNWYKKTDIWEDVKKCLEADGYTPFSQKDILIIIISNVSKFLFERKNFDITTYTRELVEYTCSKECWRTSYYHNKSNWVKEEDLKILPDYDYDVAVLYFFLFKLWLADLDELDGLPKPDKSVLPLRK